MSESSVAQSAPGVNQAPILSDLFRSAMYELVKDAMQRPSMYPKMQAWLYEVAVQDIDYYVDAGSDCAVTVRIPNVALLPGLFPQYNAAPAAASPVSVAPSKRKLPKRALYRRMEATPVTTRDTRPLEAALPPSSVEPLDLPLPFPAENVVTELPVPADENRPTSAPAIVFAPTALVPDPEIPETPQPEGDPDAAAFLALQKEQAQAIIASALDEETAVERDVVIARIVEQTGLSASQAGIEYRKALHEQEKVYAREAEKARLLHGLSSNTRPRPAAPVSPVVQAAPEDAAPVAKKEREGAPGEPLTAEEIEARLASGQPYAGLKAGTRAFNQINTAVTKKRRQEQVRGLDARAAAFANGNG